MDDKYLRDLATTYGEKTYSSLLQKNYLPEYLKIHIAQQKVLQVDGVTRLTADAAEYAPHGPYQFLRAHEYNDWNTCLGLTKSWKLNVPLLIKIKGGGHIMNDILTNPERYPIADDSIYARFLLQENVDKALANETSKE